MSVLSPCTFFFFFNDTATTEIYTLSLHDALPILDVRFNPEEIPEIYSAVTVPLNVDGEEKELVLEVQQLDRKSTRLNSSHANISYAVFCLKKKKYMYLLVMQTLECFELIAKNPVI